MPCEIQPSLLLSLDALDESTEAVEVSNVPIDSNLGLFSVELSNREADASLSREYQKAGHEKESNEIENSPVSFDKMKMAGAELFISDTVAAATIKVRNDLTRRFSDLSFKVYEDMKWLDPQNWVYDDREYGN